MASTTISFAVVVVAIAVVLVAVVLTINVVDDVDEVPVVD